VVGPVVAARVLEADHLQRAGAVGGAADGADGRGLAGVVEVAVDDQGRGRIGVEDAVGLGAQLVGLGGGQISYFDEDRQLQRTESDRLVRLSLHRGAATPQPSALLADGQRLDGAFAGASAGDTVRWQSGSLGEVSVSIDAVAWFVMPGHEAGARVLLISDGDVAPAVATCLPDSSIDMVYGIGGAPEGVLAAAALHCLGGEFCGRLRFRNDEERERARAMGMQDPDAILQHSDLVRGDVIFVATGVTSGSLLKGVRRVGNRLLLHSLALRAQTGTVRWVDTSVDARRFSFEYRPAGKNEEDGSDA